MPTRRNYRGKKMPSKVAPAPAPAPVATTTPAAPKRPPSRGRGRYSPATVARNRAAVKKIGDTVKGAAYLVGAKATEAFTKLKGPQPTTPAGRTIQKNLTGSTAKKASLVPAPKPAAAPVSKAVSDDDFEAYRKKMYGLGK